MRNNKQYKQKRKNLINSLKNYWDNKREIIVHSPVPIFYIIYMPIGILILLNQFNDALW